jgi:hypothetical protein
MVGAQIVFQIPIPVESCCPVWTGVDEGLEIRTFIYGDIPSIWVLTANTLWGNFHTGHD